MILETNLSHDLVSQNYKNLGFALVKLLKKLKFEVSEKINELAHNRCGKEDFYNYTVLQKIYFNVKSKLIGFVKTNNRRSPLSKEVQNLQRKISLTTAMYQNDRSDLLLVRLQISHKQEFSHFWLNSQFVKSIDKIQDYLEKCVQNWIQTGVDCC